MTRSLFQYDSTLGHRYIPGLRARVEHEGGGYLLRTNQAGFRCRHEFTAARTPGRRRILLFGDSYTAGDGVSDDRRYAELLEALLPDVEVFNYGLPGSGTDQQYLAWHEHARGVEHDLVVCAVLVENIRRVTARYRLTRNFGAPEVLAKPYFELDPGGGLRLGHVPVPKRPLPADGPGAPPPGQVDHGGRGVGVSRAARYLGPRMKAALQRLSRHDPVPGYRDADGPAWRLMAAILRRWADESTAPLVLFPLPLHQHVEETADATAYQARVASLAAPPRVVVVDPLPALRRRPPAERRGFRFEHDVHPTPAAHRALAQILAAGIAPLVGQGP